MNVLGIVAEYNPMHNGHIYQIKKAKEKCNADYVVAVISGNFQQRGNVSIIDKWQKAKIALQEEVDLVIELPTIYSVSSAENFAFGAIKILKELGIVNYISFGAECDNIEILNLIATTLLEEPESYKKFLKKELEKGLSFPSARANALQKYFDSLEINELFNSKIINNELLNTKSTDNKLLNTKIINNKLSNSKIINNELEAHSISKKILESATESNLLNIQSILSNPNNILGIEYLKAMKKLNFEATPIAIKRIGSEHKSLDTVNKFASSSAIRNLLKLEFDKQKNNSFSNSADSMNLKHSINSKINLSVQNNLRLKTLENVMPESSLKILKENFANGTYNIDLQNFSKIIIYKLRSMSTNEIFSLPNVNEGLENLIKKVSNETNDINELISKVKSKRYTETRIRRILIYALLGITKNDMELSKKITPYIRVLGVRKQSLNLLSVISNFSNNIITSVKDFEKLNNDNSLKRLLDIDKYATDIYTIGYKKNSKATLDYTEKLITL